MAKKTRKQTMKAEPMPGLVFNEAPAEKEPNHSPWENYNSHHAKATRWMWAGVIAMAVIIVGLWGWSLRLQAAFVSWGDLKESRFISQAKTDWNKIFSDQTPNDLQNALSVSEVKNTLKNIIATRVAAAAVASITTSTATTTTQIATTTTKTFPAAKTTTKKKK